MLPRERIYFTASSAQEHCVIFHLTFLAAQGGSLFHAADGETEIHSTEGGVLQSSAASGSRESLRERLLAQLGLESTQTLR